jgi:uncharacterized protein (TIGR00251 family)
MEAVKNVNDGLLVNIEVSPKSKKFEISGYNEWRGEIEVRITAVPQKSKANNEIIKEFSKLTKSPVEIVSGLKSQHKTLKIYDINESEFNDILRRNTGLNDKKLGNSLSV